MTDTEEFRRQLPAPLPVRPLNLPEPAETQLANGLRVVVVEQRRLPLVSFRLAFRSGDSSDPLDLPGLTDVMTDMLVEGTESRTSRRIAEEIARYGATLSAGASSDYLTVAASSLAAYADEVLELLAEVTLRPTFPENELALAKANAQQNLIAQRAQPSFLASEAVARVIFGQHPYAVVATTPVRRTDPDYFPVLVMHTILGGNASARLFMNLREEKGYTYGAYTQLDARRLAGSFRATTEVRGGVTGASLKEIFYELERVRDEDVSDKELSDAKTYLTGIFPIRLETQEGLVDQLVQIRVHDLAPDYLETYRENVQRVTKEDVRRAARRSVTPDRAAVVVVGDGAQIREQVAPYVPRVEEFVGARGGAAGA